MNFDASAADDFQKLRGKWINCSLEAISTFVTIFSSLFDHSTFIYQDFPNIRIDIFKVVSCTFAVCCKGLEPIILTAQI